MIKFQLICPDCGRVFPALVDDPSMAPICMFCHIRMDAAAMEVEDEQPDLATR